MLNNEKIINFIVPEEIEGERIDKALTGLFDEYSRSFLQKLLDEHKITVNDKEIKASYKVCTEDKIQVIIPEAKIPNIEPKNIPLDVIYEDSDVIVINKPKNMVVHPAPGHYDDTLVNALLYHCKGQLSGINGILRPGIVHRIDKDTTGSVIACKNDFAHQKISEQLKTHSVNRVYNAICFGNLKEDEFTINENIGRSVNDRKKMAVVKSGGKSAITHVKVLERFKDYTFIECKLETGRTHQIRVHLSHIGHPLLGDSVYGPSKNNSKYEGQVLHAKVLGFVHPRTGEYIETVAPLPEYFTRLISQLKR